MFHNLLQFLVTEQNKYRWKWWGHHLQPTQYKHQALPLDNSLSNSFFRAHKKEEVGLFIIWQFLAKSQDGGTILKTGGQVNNSK